MGINGGQALRQSAPGLMIGALIGALLQPVRGMSTSIWCAYKTYAAVDKDLPWSKLAVMKTFTQRTDPWELDRLSDFSWETTGFRELCSAVMDNWHLFREEDPSLGKGAGTCSEMCEQVETNAKKCEDDLWVRGLVWNSPARTSKEWNYGTTCEQSRHFLNCQCDRCDLWRSQCGCYPTQLVNTKTMPFALHSHTLMPECLDGYMTHLSTPVVCTDREWYIVGAHGATPRYACYNSVPDVEGSLQFADEDQSPEKIKGFLILDLSKVGSDVAGIVIGWVAGSVALSDLKDITLPVAVLGLSAFAVWLPESHVPSGATHIVAYPRNLVGRSIFGWETPLFDLHLPQQLAVQAQYELHLTGAALTGSDTWWWSADETSTSCANSTTQLPVPSIQGQTAVWTPTPDHTLGNRLRSVLCRKSGSIFQAVGVVWASAPAVELAAPSRWQAGTVSRVTVTGVDLPKTAALFMVPEGSECDSSVDGAGHGQLSQQVTSDHQEWHVLALRQGSYTLCWDTCVDGPAADGAECRKVASSQTVTVAACPVCDAARPCSKCFVVDNSTFYQACVAFDRMAPTLGIDVLDVPTCAGRDYSDVPPLVAKRTVEYAWAVESTMKENAKEVTISMDIASDLSYYVVSMAKGRIIVYMNTTTNEATFIGGAGSTSACGKLTRGCEYICSVPGHCPKKMFVPTAVPGETLMPCHSCGDGGFAKEARFVYPTNVRIAPSQAYLLVADAGAHRVRRIDSFPHGKVRVVAGIGQAAYSRIGAYSAIRKELGLDELNFLQGLKCSEGGPCNGDGGLAVDAYLNLPWDVAISRVASQGFLIADRMNNRIRKVAFGIITTVAGCGGTTCADANGPALQTRLNQPVGVEMLPGESGAFVFTEYTGNVVRYVDDSGTVRILAALQPNWLAPFSPRLNFGGTQLVITINCDESAASGSAGYKGCQTRTENGNTCLRWDQTAQTVAANEFEVMGEKWTHNYCRDPYSVGQLWCYVTGEQDPRRERCQRRGTTTESALFLNPTDGRFIATVKMPSERTWETGAQSTTTRGTGIPAFFDLMHAIDERDSMMSRDVVVVATAAVAAAPDGSMYSMQAQTFGLYHLYRKFVDCPPLSEYNSATKACECRPGTTPSVMDGKLVCSACSPNAYCNARDVVSECLCPDRRTTTAVALDVNDTAVCDRDVAVIQGTTCTDVLGGASPSACVCDHGYYGIKLDDSLTCDRVQALLTTCNDCHESVLCSAGLVAGTGLDDVRSTLRLQNGFWADVADTATKYRIFECVSKEQCHWTPYHTLVAQASLHGCGNERKKKQRMACASQGGVVGARAWPLEGDVGKETCYGNREGFGCARCSSGYVERTSRGKPVCKKCEFSWRYIISIIDYMSKLLALAVFYAFLNNPRGSKFMASYMIATAVSSMADFVQQYFLLADLQLVPQFDIVVGFTATFPALQIDSVPFRCIYGNVRELRYPFDMALPLQIVFMWVVLWIVLKVTKPLRRRIPSADAAILKGKMSFLQMPADFAKNLELEKNKVLNTTGFVFCVIYIALTKLSLALFVFSTRPLPSEDPTGTFPSPSGALPNTGQSNVFTLIKFPDVQLLSGDWARMLPTGILALLVVTLGWFALHVKVVIEGPTRFPKDANFRNRHKYFYGKYREDRYFWTLACFVKALCLNFVASFGTLPGIPNFKVYCMFLINLTFLTTNHLLAPFKVRLNSNLETLLHSAILALLVAGMADQAFEPAMVVPIVVLCATIFVVVFGVFFTLSALRIYKSVDWEHKTEDFVVQSTYVTKAFTSRLLKLKTTTVMKVLKQFSGPERNSIMRGLRFLEISLHNDKVLKAIEDRMQRESRRSGFDIASSRSTLASIRGTVTDDRSSVMARVRSLMGRKSTELSDVESGASSDASSWVDRSSTLAGMFAEAAARVSIRRNSESSTRDSKSLGDGDCDAMSSATSSVSLPSDDDANPEVVPPMYSGGELPVQLDDRRVVDV